MEQPSCVQVIKSIAVCIISDLKKKNIFPLEVEGKCFWVRYIFVSIYIRDFCSQCVPGLQTVIILKFTVSKCVSLVYLITVDVGQGQVHPSR